MIEPYVAGLNDPQVIAYRGKTLEEKRYLFEMEPYIPRATVPAHILDDGSLLAELLHHLRCLNPPTHAIQRYQLWGSPTSRTARDSLFMAWDANAVPWCLIVTLERLP